MSVFYDDKIEIYGISFNSVLPFDVENDVLSVIRGNFFRGGKRQSDKVYQSLGGVKLKYVYNMQKGKPLKWKVYKNGAIVEQAIPDKDGTYSIESYDNIGNVLYNSKFDGFHNWIFSTYEVGGRKITLLGADIEEEKVIIIKDGESETILYKMPFIKESELRDSVFEKIGGVPVTAFTNLGICYFVSKDVLHQYSTVIDEVKSLIEENNKPKIYISQSDKEQGFDFDSSDFNLKKNLNESFNIDDSEFFDISSLDEMPDDLEGVLIEDKDEIFSTPLMSSESKEEESTLLDNYFDKNKSEDNPLDSNVSENKDDFDFHKDISEDKYVGGTIKADIKIKSGEDIYYYFGEKSDDNLRNGYGRTSMSNGKTAYEGEYKDNKRQGFGTYYYKNGNICHVGNWKENERTGFGVGFRNSDGIIHAGVWENNKPQGLGVRFSKEGAFESLSLYDKGKESKISVEIDKDNKLCVYSIENGEKILKCKLDM